MLDLWSVISDTVSTKWKGYYRGLAHWAYTGKYCLFCLLQCNGILVPCYIDLVSPYILAWSKGRHIKSWSSGPARQWYRRQTMICGLKRDSTHSSAAFDAGGPLIKSIGTLCNIQEADLSKLWGLLKMSILICVQEQAWLITDDIKGLLIVHNCCHNLACFV